MVAILGYIRKPAFRFATDLHRQTTLDKLVRCLHDLGGVPFETLTDGDPAFCVGQTADGKAILSPGFRSRDDGLKQKVPMGCGKEARRQAEV